MILSIVIVAKNEAGNIDRCIKSILDATQNFKDKEIILVDSCSTDDTLKIAKRYPIRILQLKKNLPQSPSAAKFIGSNVANGEYILTIDGDMELLKGEWLNSALNLLKERSSIAAVTGKHYDIYCSQQNGRTTEKPRMHRIFTDTDKAHKIKYISGASLFRKSALFKAGNFHPYLRAEEEAEISHRLIINGFEVYYLPYDIVNHYTIKRNTIRETRRRLKEGLIAGIADMAKWALQKGYFSLIWKRCKIYIIFIFMIFLSLSGAVFFFFSSRNTPAILTALIPISFVVFMCFKKRSLTEGIISTVDKVLISFCIILSLFRKIKDISCYPKDFIWIKK